MTFRGKGRKAETRKTVQDSQDDEFTHEGQEGARDDHPKRYRKHCQGSDVESTKDEDAVPIAH